MTGLITALLLLLVVVIQFALAIRDHGWAAGFRQGFQTGWDAACEPVDGEEEVGDAARG